MTGEPISLQNCLGERAVKKKQNFVPFNLNFEDFHDHIQKKTPDSSHCSTKRSAIDFYKMFLNPEQHNSIILSFQKPGVTVLFIAVS
jgi:hypothetical protein